MMNVRGSLRASTVVVALALAPASMAQAPTASPPSTVDTRIGQLKYEGGYPTKETSQKLYDEIDFQRACQAYMWSFPAVSFASIKAGLFRDLGATYNDTVLWQDFLDAKGIALSMDEIDHVIRELESV